MEPEQIFSLRCHTEQAQSTKLDANLFSLRMTAFLSTPKVWWSRTGSNRRHPACKAGALPAELRPLITFVLKEVVGLGGLEPPTSRLSSARSNQLSYKPLDCAKPAFATETHVSLGQPAVAARAAPSRSAARRANSARAQVKVIREERETKAADPAL
jgi:hypothetical protein